MTARLPLLIGALVLWAHADTLILKDGTHVAGKWWSVDANEVHFLVSNQLQHYPRAAVSAVTLGDATLPAPPSAPAPAAPPTPAPAPAAAQPSLRTPTAPSLARAPSLSRAPASAPTTAPGRGGRAEPEEVGTVYFRSGSGDLTALERNQAVERRKGSTPYWEMQGPQSRVCVKAASDLVFVVRLPKGADPATYSLYPLLTASGARRTQPHPGRQANPVTWPLDVAKTGDSTFTLTVKDLPKGEYSFSPSSSNDGYCFGVDPGPTGR